MLEETERGFQATILEYASLYGWLCYHTHNSRGSVAGYPDLTLAKNGYPLHLIELKSQRGILSFAQRDWLQVLQQTNSVQAEVWRPSDWPRIQALLSSSAFRKSNK